MDRACFVNLLVQQLKENEILVANGSSVDGQKVFRELQLDFPIVSSLGLETLCTDIVSILDARASIPDWYSTSHRMYQGISYLMTQPKLDAITSKMLSKFATLFFLKTSEYLFSKDTKEPSKFVKTEEEMMEYLEAGASYEMYRGLSIEDWEACHVTACIFRVAKLLVTLDNTFNFSEIDVSHQLLGNLRSFWPKYVFLLRDRVIGNPATMKSILPSIFDLCNGCCNSADDLRITMMLLTIGGICTSLTESALTDKAYLWDFIQQHLVADIACTLQQVDTPDEVVKSMLLILTYYGAGDPRRVSSASGSTDMLLRKGIVRTLSQSFLLKRCPEEVGNNEKNVFGHFLQCSACRSPTTFEYLLCVPEFLTSVIQSEYDHTQRIGWMILISASPNSHTHCKEVTAEEITRRCLFYLTELSSELGRAQIKTVVDLFKLLLEPWFLKIVQRWSHKSTLIEVANSIFLELGSVATAALETCRDEFGPRDASIQARTICKTLVCALANVANKND